ITLFVMCFVCYNLAEFISYYRWRKKAVAAASFGSFTKSEFSEKLFFTLLVSLAAVYVVMILLTTVLSGNPTGLWLLGDGVFFVIVSAVIDKENEKSKGKKKKALSVLSFIMFVAMISAGYFVKNHYDEADSYEPETYISVEGYEKYAYIDDIPLKMEDMGLDVNSNQFSYILTEQKSTVVTVTEASQSARMDIENYYDLPYLDYTVYEIKWQFLFDCCFEKLFNNVGSYRTYEQIDETVWKADKAYYKAVNSYLLCYGDKIVEIESSWEITPEQAAVVAEVLG
ncbi:MAG: hypothetical protein IKT78_03390, partial [Ruminiclostridium sp.]|nr:hypothetical protein [Ruminiclostridium sp.]